jgi:AcrR family transcriptional regulator
MQITKGQRTRRAIMETAHRLFIEGGFHGTSMRTIAEEAGIALGGIYNHFSGKEALFREVLLANHPYHEIIPALQQASSDTFEDFVREAADQMIAAVDRRPGFLHLVFIELVEFNGRHMQTIFADVLPDLQAILEKFPAWRDTLRPIPLPLLLRAFMGLFFSYILSAQILSDHAPPEFRENALDGLVDIFLHGVLAGGPYA